MNVKHITPFMEALIKILEQHGISGIKRGAVVKKDVMTVDQDITSVIGINGGIRGNIAYSLSDKTAIRLLTAMKLTVPAQLFGPEARYAVGAMTEMIISKASELILEEGIIIYATPPTIVFGEEIHFNISPVQTIAVNIETPCGTVEINIGLEE